MDWLPFVVFIGLMIVLFGSMEIPVWLQGYRPRTPPRGQPRRSRTSPTQSLSFRGGVRLGWFNATVPFGRLDVDEESARVGVSDLVWIERSQVVSVRRVRTLLGSGVRFETADGRYDGVIFWSFDSRSVLAGFNQLGWPTA